MNQHEDTRMLARAEGLLKRAKDAGSFALRTARDASERVLKGAGEDETKAARRRRRLLIGIGGGVIAVIAIIAVVSRLGGEGGTETEAPAGQAVTVITTATTSFQPAIALNGEARPIRDIQVAAPATGVRILQLMVDEGDTVREGQPMARLDTSLAQAQLRAAQASVAEAESAAVRARGEYERAESIRDSGALSTEAIEARRAAATAADARLAATRAQLQEVNSRLGGGYVRAPAAGLVIDRTAEVGRNVDGQVLFRIAAGNELEVAAQVAEAEALALEVGQRATFTLVDGTTVEGTLRRLPASIDSRTRTGEALFSLPHDTRVRAGMFLRGHAVLAPHDVLAIPQSSILYDSGQAYVFVLDQENVVHRANVELGARNGDLVEVRSGLELNQRIVGAGAAFLQDGEPVRPLTPEPSPASTARDGEQLRGRQG